MQSKYTWTGKSADGEDKIAFRDYKQIVSLIHVVVRRADANYSMKNCVYNLTYSILKYASAKKKKLSGGKKGGTVRNKPLVVTETVSENETKLFQMFKNVLNNMN